MLSARYVRDGCSASPHGGDALVLKFTALVLMLPSYDHIDVDFMNKYVDEVDTTMSEANTAANSMVCARTFE